MVVPLEPGRPSEARQLLNRMLTSATSFQFLQLRPGNDRDRRETAEFRRSNTFPAFLWMCGPSVFRADFVLSPSKMSSVPLSQNEIIKCAGLLPRLSVNY